MQKILNTLHSNILLHYSEPDLWKKQEIEDLLLSKPIKLELRNERNLPFFWTQPSIKQKKKIFFQASSFNLPVNQNENNFVFPKCFTTHYGVCYQQGTLQIKTPQFKHWVVKLDECSLSPLLDLTFLIPSVQVIKNLQKTDWLTCNYLVAIIEASFNTSDSNSIGIDCFLRKFEGIHCTGPRDNGGYSLTGCIFPMGEC